MKSTSNKVQRDYMVAKARVEALEEQEKEMEQAYIAAHGIVNPDGTVPERIYCISDEAVFDEANEGLDAEIKACGLEDERSAAKATLRTAEDRLVEYGLSLTPVGIRATLEKGAKERLMIRQKLIDMVFRLDVSTLPSGCPKGAKSGGERDET